MLGQPASPAPPPSAMMRSAILSFSIYKRPSNVEMSKSSRVPSAACAVVVAQACNGRPRAVSSAKEEGFAVVARISKLIRDMDLDGATRLFCAIEVMTSSFRRGRGPRPLETRATQRGALWPVQLPRRHGEGVLRGFAAISCSVALHGGLFSIERAVCCPTSVPCFVSLKGSWSPALAAACFRFDCGSGGLPHPAPRTSQLSRRSSSHADGMPCHGME